MYWHKIKRTSLIQQSRYRRFARVAWPFKHSSLALWPLSVASLVAVTMSQGWAACTINVQSVNFGNYNPSSILSRNSIGNINLNCGLLFIALPYTLSLSTGEGSYEQRTMSSGINVLNYNLYTDLTHLSVWGNGTGGTAIVAGLGLTGIFTISHTIYGSIPAKQNVSVGNYSDSIVVTLTY